MSSNVVVAKFQRGIPILCSEGGNDTNATKSSTQTKKKPVKRLSNASDDKQLLPKNKRGSKVILNECIKRTSTDKQNLILQKKSIVFNVYSFFKKLAARPRRLNFNQAQRLTAEACGISLASVKRVTRSYCIVERAEEVDVETSEVQISDRFLDDTSDDGMIAEDEIGQHVLVEDSFFDEIREDKIVVIENNDAIEDVPCTN